MSKTKIKKIKAREILDSRGRFTVEVDLFTETGFFRASVPSGTSKGKYEAKELDAWLAVKNINKIIGPKLKGKDITQQKEIDQFLIDLDGTKNKSRLGANAILGVSMAVCRANGLPAQKILPKPCFLLIEGGMHAGNNLDIQEFMIKPAEKTFSKNFQAGVKIYHCLKKILEKNLGKSAINVGLEGGFAPPIKKTNDVLDLIVQAIKKSGYKNVGIILDAAASSFYKKGIYQIEGKKFNRDELLDFYLDLIKKYPIKGIEDPFSEDDLQGFRKMAENSSLLIIGDDLTVTNLSRVKMAVKEKAINALIIKPNQIGTVSETLETAKFAQKQGLKIFVKHRSGETNDDFIADLAAGIGADGIMAGAPTRGERVAKYNRLLRIEEELK